MLCTAHIYAAPEDPEEGGEWGPVLAWPHIAVSAANLPDGRILTWSGSERDTWPTTEQTYSATWDPETGEFIEVFHESHNMFCAHLAMLEDGRVFVNGGRNQTNSPWTSLFDYRGDEWIQIENMPSGGRWYPTTVALSDGNIFTAIGTATLQQYPEQWDPDTGWQIQNGIDFDEMVLTPYFDTNSHGESRWWPLLHVAPNGELFHSGPTPQMHFINTAGNGSYAEAGPEFTNWYHKHGTTVMYDEGKLLTAGGWIGGSNTTSTNKSFTVNLNGPSPVVAMTNDMIHARKFQNGVVLPNGKVLVIGGNTSGAKFSDSGAILATETWDPATGQWQLGAAMTIPRNYHSIALLLTDGRVLAAGSGYCSSDPNCSSSHQDGQVYSPAYLFDENGDLASRPEITSGPGKIASNEVFQLTATPGMQYFSMIKMSSTSHGVNTDVRHVRVPFSETSPGQYELTANGNQHVLTAGYWMIFAVGNDGVPSEAHVVQANTSGLPWISNINNQSNAIGENVSLQVIASDADNDVINYSATGLPPGLTLNSATGLISGIPASEGTYAVTVTAADGDEGSRQRSFDWIIFGAGLGHITRDWWLGINGNAITDLTGNPNYPDNPDGSEQVSLFEGPTNWNESYGSRIFGYVYPPVTGNYTFWIATDDNGELWLSSNDEPQNKSLIAHVPSWAGSRDWTKFPEQQSAQVFLQQGEPYFIEALQKEGGGGDNIAVAWALPGESTPTVIDGAYLSPYVEIVDPPANVEVGVIPDVGSDWITVQLANSYTDMVVIATPQYGFTDAPAVTRVRNATDDTFEVRVQNPSDAALSGYTVHYLVTEAGQYENNGASMEAIKYTSIVTDNDGSWVGEQRSYLKNYTNPVVLGQVMSDNDSQWSTFWSSDGTYDKPPSATAIYTGKHVGEDISTLRAPETIGYIVIEAGSGNFGNFAYQVALGPTTVTGVEDGGASYPLSGSVDAVFVSGAAMIGANGGWPIVSDTADLSSGLLPLGYDEDMIVDPERMHIAEQVAYLAITGDINLPVQVESLVSVPSVSGQDVNYTVDANVDYLLYSWNFGDNTPEILLSQDSTFAHTYVNAGRYVVVLTIDNPLTGDSSTQTFVQLIHAPLTAQRPNMSSTIAVNDNNRQVWNVNPDNQSATVIDMISESVLAEVTVGAHPVSVAIAPDDNAWVVNKDDATISVIDSTSLSVIDTYSLPFASRPHGLVFSPDGSAAFVTLEATGELIKINPVDGSIVQTKELGPHPRHVSISGDSQTLMVTQFITPPLPGESTDEPVTEAGGVYFGAQIWSLATLDLSITDNHVLRHSDRGVSEHSGPGIPNYLGPAVISPDGLGAWIPSKQDNILAGALRGGQGMTFDQTVRAVTSKINLLTGDETFSARIDHDNAGLGSHAAFGPYGAYLFVTLEANREVVVNDAYSATEMVRFDVGRAPQGIALSGNGNTLYVHNFMDRSVSIYNVSNLVHEGGLTVTEEAIVPTVSTETLTPQVLLGKQHFYDSRDPRLAGDSYMSCASCHNDGREDGRVWDFTGVGEGLRNTITLAGRGGMNHGFIHWSANFDEIQDFEGQIRNFAGGTGLMDDADFDFGNRSEPMGLPKTGLSADLDALAAYISSLSVSDPSPHRSNSSGLSADALAGEQIFADAGCDSCHVPLRFTDSSLVTLHDIGTMDAHSGNRLDGPLAGFDTPSLLSLWHTGPYLHDGSALDLSEAINAHQSVNLPSDQVESLVSYLLELDEVTGFVDEDSDGIANVNDNCLTVANATQVDSDNDGIGNACDADLNNDCVVNFFDHFLFQQEFLAIGDNQADFNGDEVVNFFDLPVLMDSFLQVPGPSSLPNSCASP